MTFLFVYQRVHKLKSSTLKNRFLADPKGVDEASNALFSLVLSNGMKGIRVRGANLANEECNVRSCRCFKDRLSFIPIFFDPSSPR